MFKPIVSRTIRKMALAWLCYAGSVAGQSLDATTVTLPTQLVSVDETTWFESKLLGIPGAVYRIEFTTNWWDWMAVSVLTNTGGVFSFRGHLDAPSGFYRVVLEHLPE